MVCGNGAVAFDIESLYMLPELQTDKPLASINNVMLISGGHRPQTRREFDPEKLKRWCELNCIDLWIRDWEQEVVFKFNVDKYDKLRYSLAHETGLIQNQRFK